MAVFRMALGLVALFEFCSRFPFIEAHYTADGVFPAFLARNYVGLDHSSAVHIENGNFLSLNFIHDAYWFQLALLIVGIAGALSLIVGWKSTLGAVVVWAINLSFANRFILDENPAPYFIGMMSLIGIFLPWNKCLNIKTGWKFTASETTSLSTASLVFFLCCTVWIAGLGKAGGYWLEGTGLHYLLRLGSWETRWTWLILENPTLSLVLNYFTVFAEILAPLMIVLPFSHPFFRAIGCLSLIGMFLSIRFFMSTHLVVVLMGIGFIAFIPTWFWCKLYDYLPRSGKSRSSEVFGRTSEVQQVGVIGKIVLISAMGVFALAQVNKIPKLLGGPDLINIPVSIDQYLSQLHIFNRFNFFSWSSPAYPDSWYEVEVQQEDGGWVNAYVPSGIPSKAEDRIGGFRWSRYSRFLFDKMAKMENKPNIAFDLYGSYMCKGRSGAHSIRVVKKVAGPFPFGKSKQDGETQEVFFEHKCTGNALVDESIAPSEGAN
jgi:hypothetical protein